MICCLRCLEKETNSKRNNGLSAHRPLQAIKINGKNYLYGRQNINYKTHRYTFYCTSVRPAFKTILTYVHPAGSAL